MVGQTKLLSYRGRELNTNFFFSNFSGTPGDIPAKSRDTPPKKFDFPGFEGHIELLGPHPLQILADFHSDPGIAFTACAEFSQKTAGFRRNPFVRFHLSAKPETGRQEGDGKKAVINYRKMSQDVL